MSHTTLSSFVCFTKRTLSSTADLFTDLSRNFKALVLLQLLEAFAYKLRVAVRLVVDEALQVGGFQDINGRRLGLLDLSGSDVVHSRVDEFCESVVGIGCTDKSPERNSHCL